MTPPDEDSRHWMDGEAVWRVIDRAAMVCAIMGFLGLFALALGAYLHGWPS